jgi:hypothetical protein
MTTESTGLIELTQLGVGCIGSPQSAATLVRLRPRAVNIDSIARMQVACVANEDVFPQPVMATTASSNAAGEDNAGQK